MNYALSNKAEIDIIRIFVDGTRSFGAKQAEKYHVELEATFLFLAENPLVNREQKELEPPVRIHPFQSHLIAYIVTTHDEIFIVRILHKHEDWRNKPV
ncbi:type II toxin-antitoxin system RelE/ParE family toxin [Reinekea forsetii]|nr:type II toxin-antitoxin system RelE/ParE family toxin [Reinekea forsetii]